MGKGAWRKLNPERDVMHIMTKPIFYANIPAVGNLVSSLLTFLLSFGRSPGVSGDGYEVRSASHQCPNTVFLFYLFSAPKGVFHGPGCQKGVVAL